MISDIAPWAKTCDPRVVYETRQVALATLRIAGICLKPFVPSTADNLLEALGLDEEEKSWQSVLQYDDNATWKERDVKGVRLF